MAARSSMVIATILGIHLIDSNVLLPVIVGSKVRINAFITVLGVIIGEAVWGIAGTFLAIPIIAISKIILNTIEELQLKYPVLPKSEKEQLQQIKEMLEKE